MTEVEDARAPGSPYFLFNALWSVAECPLGLEILYLYVYVCLYVCIYTHMRIVPCESGSSPMFSSWMAGLRNGAAYEAIWIDLLWINLLAICYRLMRSENGLKSTVNVIDEFIIVAELIFFLSFDLIPLTFWWENEWPAIESHNYYQNTRN